MRRGIKILKVIIWGSPQAGIKIAGRNINNLRYAESEEELKSKFTNKMLASGAACEKLRFPWLTALFNVLWAWIHDSELKYT